MRDTYDALQAREFRREAILLNHASYVRNIPIYKKLVGIHPKERRMALRDLISAHGVSNVFPLGQCERLYPGMPHDGIAVLNQLVDWKNS